MSEQPKQYHHVVRRVTNEGDAARHLNEAYNNGFTLLSFTGGGGDGNVLWLVFQREGAPRKEPTPTITVSPPSTPQPMGGSFD